MPPKQDINISAPAFTPLQVHPRPIINVTQAISLEPTQTLPQQKCQRTNSKKLFAQDTARPFYPTATQLPGRKVPNTSAAPFNFSAATKVSQLEMNYDSGSDKQSMLTGSTRYSSDEESDETHFNLSPPLHHVSSTPVRPTLTQPKFKHQKSSVAQPMQPVLSSQGSQQQEEWKQKVKTELCKFWLEGATCENVLKDQGCGFAHGESELQPKKGLNKQYLTSVCKNFIDSPEKCTYGHRCIFQHPSLDVNERQSYRDMMKDNVKYTAMRMFQNIPGAETLYINTYALNAPRLSAFKNIPLCTKDTECDSVRQ